MKRILLCLDKSPLAADVHRAALDIARSSRAKVRFFRVIEGAGELPETDEDLVTAARSELDQFGRNDPSDLVAGSRAEISEVTWKAICEAAREENADLIVIGAHSHGLIARVLGTTAASVVNHADRSVLVVRSPKEHAMDSRSRA
jgi:nucleotide-binding universal stress UspA family protein